MNELYPQVCRVVAQLKNTIELSINWSVLKGAWHAQ